MALVERQTADEPETVAERLAGASLVLTGATGFLGKAVLAAWLAEVPDTGEVRVLLRAADDDQALERLRTQVLASGAFEELDPDALAEAVDTGRLRALACDLADDRLGGLADGELADADVVVNCAASVSFEQPLDEMIELNVLGPLRLADALARAGAYPHMVHVSTAYAAGQRTGLVLERPYGADGAEPDVDTEAELDAARAWRRELEAESRRPHHQERLVADARHELGPAGALAIGARAEELRRDWVRAELTERGRARCRALGWSDAYGLSKGLAERALVARGVRPLTIVRPSIIESALARPRPGWIEGLKVADPVILAYARGLLPRFPGEPSARLDLVPVDLVAHACVAAAAHPPEDGPRTLAVVSGARNPLRIARVADEVADHFRARPLPDDDGAPVEVPDLRFQPRGRVLGALERGQRGLALGRRLLDRVPLPRADELERRLHRERRRLERLRRLAEIYGPYVELDCVFDDRETQALRERLAPEDHERLPFDTAAIDWTSYLHEVHLPALRELARAAAPRPRAVAVSPGRREPVLADGPPALAFFDVEGVVLDTTVAHFYAWLRARTMPRPDRQLWLASLAARAPGYKLLDRRSRAAFNRSFYRLYRRLPAADLRERAPEALSEFILPRMQHAAVRRIRAHRARGDRVVLITGGLDFLVEPLRHLADELVAARLVEDGGAFTGELAEPPLTAEGRASLAARLAAEHGVALADCHAYADSVADLPLLEVSGHPHAVNPDFRLAREARRRGWEVLRWETEPGARTRPPAPVEARA